MNVCCLQSIVIFIIVIMHSQQSDQPLCFFHQSASSRTKLRYLSSRRYNNPIDRMIHCLYDNKKIRIEQQNAFTDSEQFLKRFYRMEQYETKITLLSEYYKFHFSFPRIFIPGVEQIMEEHCAAKREIQYEKVTKQLDKEYYQKSSCSDFMGSSNLLDNISLSTVNPSVIELEQFDSPKQVNCQQRFLKRVTSVHLKNSGFGYQPKERLFLELLNKNVIEKQQVIQNPVVLSHQQNQGQTEDLRIVKKRVISTVKISNKQTENENNRAQKNNLQQQQLSTIKRLYNLTGHSQDASTSNKNSPQCMFNSQQTNKDSKMTIQQKSSPKMIASAIRWQNYNLEQRTQPSNKQNSMFQRLIQARKRIK